MQKIQVLDPKGAMLKGPMTVVLTFDQWARNADVLGNRFLGGRFDVAKGASIRLHQGEQAWISAVRGPRRAAIRILAPVGPHLAPRGAPGGLLLLEPGGLGDDPVGADAVDADTAPQTADGAEDKAAAQDAAGVSRRG